jgi:enolase-phosphatase E1
VLEEVTRLAPGEDPLRTLLGWMERDEKIFVLKTIQGIIWADGYASGEITGEVYPEVPPALRRWANAGLRLYVYSSGSVASQKLLFKHAAAGDLSLFFQGFFDTAAGPKREVSSYVDICRGANIAPAEMLFLSDVTAELDAAAAAGLQTCHIIRPEDGTVAGGSHQAAVDFNEVALRFGLPRAA